MTKNYTPEQIDKHLSDLEAFALKIEKVAGSVVKRRGAEQDILKEAEKCDVTLFKALKGDKGYLEQIFGGTCERIARLRVLIDTVEFKDSMNNNDERWARMTKAIETIEKILQDAGMFKKWTPGAVEAPANLIYKLRRRLSPGRKLRVKPDIDGGECTFRAEGLPAGLELDPVTGVITGSIDTPNPEVIFKITAENASGTSDCEINFSCTEPPPTGMSYPGLEGLLTVGENQLFVPVFENGAGKSFKVEPALPGGLEIDEFTGHISGRPAESTAAHDYTVTASNMGGETTCTVNFGTEVPAPANLHYDIPAEMGVGRSVMFEPEMDGGRADEFSVSPALPDGLSVDKKTGLIQGNPTSATDLAVYVVAAKNAGGLVKTEVQFAVVSYAPISFSYPGVKDTYTNREEIRLVPNVGGGQPDTFTVEPPLPSGLILSSVTGEIVGIPEVVQDKGTWTVTGTNAGGSISCDVSFAVTRAPPNSLKYPSAEPVYAAGATVRVMPSVDGEIDTFTVSPPLPAGVELDPTTGVISGEMPQANIDETEYTFTAANDQGTVDCKVRFQVKVMPPTALSYNNDEVYHVGESISLEPMLEGGADKFVVSPDLPPGFELNELTGMITGAPTEVASSFIYTVTAKNEGGEVSAELTFQVDPCAPESLDYPTLSSELVVEEEVDVDAVVHPPSKYTFTVEPALPDGLTLDPDTGKISGSPTTEDEDEEAKTYKVTASNVSGSVSKEIELLVEAKPEEILISEAFAKMLDDIEDVDVLLEKAPEKSKKFGDWMIWMVHRAYLNDPSLTDFNFTQCKMPRPHEEYRVAPKLMKALETNTHIERLSLAHANMHKPQGPELSEALKKNCTIHVLNLEGNHLDADCLKVIAEGILENKNSTLQEVRVAHQQGMGRQLGRPVEWAFRNLMQSNQTIIKLGLYCDDADNRNVIDTCMLRNNDRARRLRKRRSASGLEAELPVEEKTLATLQLLKPPSVPVQELLEDTDKNIKTFKEFLVKNKKMPNNTQLQAFAKSAGNPMKYNEVKPTLELCRSRLLNAANRTKVEVTDAFGAKIDGALLKWEVKKVGGMVLELLGVEETSRYNCTSGSEPGIVLSDNWARWLDAQPLKDDED